jgi:hypothetical protein
MTQKAANSNCNTDNNKYYLKLGLVNNALKDILETLLFLKELDSIIFDQIDSTFRNISCINKIIDSAIALDNSNLQFYIISEVGTYVGGRYVSPALNKAFHLYNITTSEKIEIAANFLPVYNRSVESLDILDKKHTKINFKCNSIRFYDSCPSPLNNNFTLFHLDNLLHNINTVHIINASGFYADYILTDILTNIRNRKIFKEIIDLTKTYNYKNNPIKLCN